MQHYAAKCKTSKMSEHFWNSVLKGFHEFVFEVGILKT
jgi:hypothetical protein